MKKINTLSVFFSLLLSVSFYISCDDPDTVEEKCSDDNPCPRGFICEEAKCACPSDDLLYYQYCVSLDDTPTYIATGGCECSDSLLWKLGELPDDTTSYYVRNTFFPEIYVFDTISSIRFTSYLTYWGYPNNRDSFYIPFYKAVSGCPYDSNNKNIFAYASGIFTSDSTGYMHLDWHNDGDSLPYRRCTMPFTRIK